MTLTMCSCCCLGRHSFIMVCNLSNEPVHMPPNQHKSQSSMASRQRLPYKGFKDITFKCITSCPVEHWHLGVLQVGQHSRAGKGLWGDEGAAEKGYLGQAEQEVAPDIWVQEVGPGKLWGLILATQPPNSYGLWEEDIYRNCICLFWACWLLKPIWTARRGAVQ